METVQNSRPTAPAAAASSHHQSVKTTEVSKCMMTRSRARCMRAESDTDSTKEPGLGAPEPAKKSAKRKRSDSTSISKRAAEKAAKISCLLCEDEPPAVTFHPCNHQVCCLDCSLRLKKCPKCKKKIDQRLDAGGHSIEIEKPISYMMLLSKVRELEDNQLCTICMTNRWTVAFNCGHLACHSCTNTLTNCHYCRAEIKSRIKIYEV